MKTTRDQRWWDLPAAIFLFGALFSAAVRLHATGWTEHLGRVEFNVILATILGFALGISIFRGRTVFWMALAYSIFFVPWQLFLIVTPMNWHDRLQLLYARVWYATADFLANQPVKDPILFLGTMMLLYWFASLMASYYLVRRANPWIPLLTLGGMILVIEYTMEMSRFGRSVGGTYSFIFLLFCLLLMGRLYFLHARREWQDRGGTVELEVGTDLGRGVALAALVLALLAWNTPRVVNFFDSDNPARERVSRAWQDFRDRISKAANSLTNPNPMVVEGYGSNLALGTGGNLSSAEVFSVTTDDGLQSLRMYWMARTYDTYDDGQWTTGINDIRPIGPGSTTIEYDPWKMRGRVEFTFYSNISLLRTLYYPAEPLNIDREAQAIVEITEEGTTDLNALVLDPPLQSGEQYQVLALTPRPTVLALMNAGDNYPEWVTDRYLSLPEDMSPRISELAEQIAADRPTAYDQVVSITQYLRRTITYAESVPEPPSNRDPIEWFLFDYRSGFCNYYATAEILMLRSLGIPARLSVGYAQGTWEPERNAYVVLGKDSHAWPEVYFPGIGWVPFEPTVSQPITTFPAGSDETDDQDFVPLPPAEPTIDPMSLANRQGQEPFDPSMLETDLEPWWTTVPLWVWIAAPIALVAGLLAFFEYRRRKSTELPLISWLEKAFDERGWRTPDWMRLWSRRALRTPMENLFAQVSMMLRIWGRKPQPALTPAEQVALLVDVVPTVRDPAMILLEEYQLAMYSPYAANFLRARQAVTELQRVGYRSRLMRLVGLETDPAASTQTS